MGYMTVLGTCLLCKQFFSFNPDRVPSFQGEPICKDCILEVNRRRRKAKLPEWPVFDDAYDPQRV